MSEVPELTDEEWESLVEEFLDDEPGPVAEKYAYWRDKWRDLGS